MFADRVEAGALLAQEVAGLGLVDPLVLALPRGGVPVAAAIARRLGAPLDVVLVRKLGAPDEPELAIGAVADGGAPVTVLNDRLVAALGVSAGYIAAETARQLKLIEQRRASYAGLRPQVSPAGRAAVVVDDGVATGMTMQVALRSVRSLGPSRLVAAVPVASEDALRMLQAEADEAVCLSAPREFLSVGSFYRAFEQVSDAEVERLLRQGGEMARP
jgi:putative phosphoribosyl transferase